MERYLTKDLKKEIDDHEERIGNLKGYVDIFSNHLQRHDDKLDPLLIRADTILFGEKGDDGIVREVQDMSKLKNDIRHLKWLLIGAVIVQIALKYIPA